MNRHAINDIFWVPEDFHLIKDGNQVSCHPERNLPNYRPIRISERSELTLTDCHSAIRATIRQTRLIAFEIAGKNKSFFKRSLKTITLEGEPKEFDILLSSIDLCFKGALMIKSIDVLAIEHPRLLDVLKNPLIAHKDFRDSSGTLPPDLQRFSQDLDI